MQNILLVLIFGAAVVLTLLSAWTWSNFAYYVLVALFAGSFILFVVTEYFAQGVWSPKTIFISGLAFVMFHYVVSVQKVTGRKVWEVTSNEDYKTFLIERNMYRGFPKFLYFYPLAFFVIGLPGAIYLKFFAR